MGAQNRQWILLDECINAYLDESEQGNHKYFKCWNLAFRAMTELGLDFFYTVKSVKLPVNPNLTVSLPEDYISYTKIGVLNNQGEIIPLISIFPQTRGRAVCSHSIQRSRYSIFALERPYINAYFSQGFPRR